MEKGKKTIPVIVDNAKMPTINELPENLHEFTYLNNIELRDNKWSRDMDEAMDETLEFPRIEGEKCADANDAELDRFARLLVQ